MEGCWEWSLGLGIIWMLGSQVKMFFPGCAVLQWCAVTETFNPTSRSFCTDAWSILESSSILNRIPQHTALVTTTVSACPISAIFSWWTTSSSAQAGTTRGRADGFSVEAHLLQKIYQFRRQSLVWPTERCCPKCAPWRARCTALSLPTLSKALQFSMSDLFCKRIEQRTWIHETHIFFHIFRFSPAFFLVLASERVWPSPTLSSKSLTANRLVLPTLLCWISWRNPQRTHTLLLSHTSLIKLE